MKYNKICPKCGSEEIGEAFDSAGTYHVNVCESCEYEWDYIEAEDVIDNLVDALEAVKKQYYWPGCQALMVEEEIDIGKKVFSALKLVGK